MTNFMPAGPALTRRKVIAGGLAAGVILPVLGLGSRVIYRGKPHKGFKVLSAREAAALEAAALAYFPTGNSLGLDGREANIARYIDRYVAALGWMEEKMIRGMVFAFDQGTLLSSQWKPLHRMSQPEVELYLRSWEESSIRLKRDVSTGFKSLLSFAYFSQPQVLDRLGIKRHCPSMGPSFLV